MSALLLLLTLVLCSAAAAAYALQCAGFLPNDPQYADLLREARVDLPALFISGQADALIPPHRSKVRGLCCCCLCVYRGGGVVLMLWLSLVQSAQAVAVAALVLVVHC